MTYAFKDIRPIKSPYCSKLFFVGGQAVTPEGEVFPVFGKGPQQEIALQKLRGEAAERASVMPLSRNRVWRAENPLTAEVLSVVPQAVFGHDWRPNSHGCAAHNALMTAQFLAALELLERQAVEHWWQGKATPKRIALTGSHGGALARDIAALRAGARLHRRTELFLLSHLADVFVVAAVSMDKDRDQLAIGFAAHYDWTQAALRAVQEVASVELETADLAWARMQDPGSVSEGSNRARVRDLQLRLRARYESELLDRPTLCLSKLKTSWPANRDALVHAAAVAGKRLLFVDMTDDRIGLPVSRAMFEEPPHLPLQQVDDEELPL